MSEVTSVGCQPNAIGASSVSLEERVSALSIAGQLSELVVVNSQKFGG
ncbi:hypothetical protein [Neorhodopirellula lusitana]|nr:hypothetical protein [Neorhodopirellula lusitana]